MVSVILTPKFSMQINEETWRTVMCNHSLMEAKGHRIITMTYQITSLMTAYSIIYSGADQRKHRSFASLAFVRGIHRWPVNSPHKGPVTRKIFSFDDVTTAIWRCRNPFSQWRRICQWKLLPSAKILCHSAVVIQGPVLLLWHDPFARLLANGSAAFIESCAAIGWKDCDSVRSPGLCTL